MYLSGSRANNFLDCNEHKEVNWFLWMEVKLENSAMFFHTHSKNTFLLIFVRKYYLSRICIYIHNTIKQDFLLHWYSWAWLWWGFECFFIQVSSLGLVSLYIWARGVEEGENIGIFKCSYLWCQIQSNFSNLWSWSSLHLVIVRTVNNADNWNTCWSLDTEPWLQMPTSFELLFWTTIFSNLLNSVVWRHLGIIS